MSKKNYKLNLSADLAFAAGDGERQPTVDIVAYTGDAIAQAWSDVPLVVDLAGVKAGGTVPVLYAHGREDMNTLDSVVGASTGIENTGRQLNITADLIRGEPNSDKLIRLGSAGVPLQASIGASVDRTEYVKPGTSVTVNGREFSGPLTVVRASRLREVSLVLFGADANTSAAIAADASSEVDPMADKATDKPEDVKASAEDTAKAAVGTENKTVEASLGIKANGEGASLTAESVAEVVLAKLREERLAETRADRAKSPAVHVVDAVAVNSPQVIEAGLCLAGGLPNVEKAFDAKTLELADKRHGRGSLQEVLIEAARANGYTGHYRIDQGNCKEVLASAFSTHSISNVLAATYGKFMRAGFDAVEREFEKISSVRSVPDYKTMTGVRVNGGFDFLDVGPTGEIKDAAASDETRTIQAKLTGRLTKVSMVDIINDDLGMLSQVPARLGRGAALKLNTDFWAAFVAGSYGAASPGGGNAFSLTSLKAAVAAWKKLTDTDGNPLGIPAKYLVVPPELEIAAAELMASSLLISGNTTASGNANVLAGRYEVVCSAYLTTATTWWLVASPMDLPAMEIAYLNGQRAPTVESADVDFAQLGVQFRGHFSYGVAVAETKGAYKMATS
jgi:phage major head subunit gpT-like protein